MGGQAKHEAKHAYKKFGWQISWDEQYVSHLYGICPLCFNYEIIDEPWPIEDKKREKKLRKAVAKNHVCGPVNKAGLRDWEDVL